MHVNLEPNNQFVFQTRHVTVFATEDTEVTEDS